MLGVLCGAAILAPVASFARPYDEVIDSGVLRVALYRDNAPFSDDPDGKPVGIDVDLATRIAEKLGVKPEIRIVEASENVDGDFRLNLWRGDLAGSKLADLMLNVPADKMLAVRNEQVAFTAPYAEQRLAVAYRRDSVEGGFQDVQDVQGRSVAVEGTSPVDALIGFANGGIYRDSLKHFRTFGEAAASFLTGEAEFLGGTRAAIEAAVAKAAPAARAGEIDVKDLAGTGLVKPRWEICGAVRIDSRDLGYRIGDAVAALTAEGALKSIYEAHGATFSAPAGY
ncbi:transporter substrate-binding domain-containing protein [Methylopila sp. M107]|uniref:transporter substrate-binding domain-containing protein n=1 Tax=Methylopila sp. M107 TaxID=1101190 RepID=UPI00037C2C62|nr:transporter substrate-binding domain-containing protein [Methylopila sp. M107]